jgi:hypothetical protein
MSEPSDPSDEEERRSPLDFDPVPLRYRRMTAGLRSARAGSSARWPKPAASRRRSRRVGMSASGAYDLRQRMDAQSFRFAWDAAVDMAVLRMSAASRLLIDADNVSHGKIAAMLAELSKYGVANIRRAYGDWASPGLKGWTARLHEHAIRPIQQFSYSRGKNATDMALVIDAMELLYTQKPDAFCIASSDADFTPLVMQLRANGHEVYGFGERKTPEPFVNACSTFLYLDSLGEEAPPPPVRGPAPARRRPKAEAKPAAAPKARACPPPRRRAAAPRPPLARTPSWSRCCAARSRRRRATTAGPISPPPAAPPSARPRSIRAITAPGTSPSCSKRPACSTSSRRRNGQTYVADKRNKDRAPAPGGARGEALAERLPAAIGMSARPSPSAS